MASFSLRQDETDEMRGRPVDAQAQRRQRVLVGLAGLLACLFFVLDLQLPLGVANAVL
mgnify:FL=1